MVVVVGVVLVIVVLEVVFVVLVVVSKFEIMNVWLIHPCSWDGQSIN